MRELAAATVAGLVRATAETSDGFLEQVRRCFPHAAMQKVANRSVRAWHGATENCPRTMDKSQTFAYVRVRVRTGSYAGTTWVVRLAITSVLI